jgi:2-isopropylmalate synthase
LGCTFESEEIAEIYSRFTALADRKKNIYDQDLLALIPSRVPEAIAA